MRGHLVDVCRQARDDAGASKTRIAAAINKGEQSVSRFEQGVGGWHHQTGELVDAYAEVSGIPSWELWQMAINQWKAAQAEDDDQSLPVPAHPPRAPRLGGQSKSSKDRRQAGS